MGNYSYTEEFKGLWGIRRRMRYVSSVLAVASLIRKYGGFGDVSTSASLSTSNASLHS